MQVHILPFGVLKDWLGTSGSTIELHDGATVADLLVRLAHNQSGPAAVLRGIAVSVNAEYALAAHVLRDGDEVGLLPPVSGGGALRAADVSEEPVITALTRDVIDADRLVASAKRGEDGAAVVFDGIVRNHTRDRHTLYLDYEAYEEMALKQMDSLSRQA